MYRTIQWTTNGVVMIDQRLLPGEEVYVTLGSAHEVAEAIKNMIIRGAPAIGVAAAMGIALGINRLDEHLDKNDVDSKFVAICDEMAKTRPTAVNLFWAIERMRIIYEKVKGKSLTEIKKELTAEALRIYESDIECNRRIGHFGQILIPLNATVLTHCNAGGLATGGYGTALGVIRAATEYGKKLRVFADETRPFLQGARLTAWELKKLGIPVIVITDNMSGYFMSKGKIDAVVVGADRIASNGDTANKIGTYMVAVLAKRHNIPFYVAAPISTIDFSIRSGSEIPIEERNEREVTHIGDKQITPDGIEVRNPAFDITPSSLISAIITDRGIARYPFEESLDNLKNRNL